MAAALVVRAAEGGDLTWVLLAANGRPLARSAGSFRTAESLAAAWRELVADRGAVSVRLGRDGPGRNWWWSATLPARSTALGAAVPSAGVMVARSARGYSRADQCRDAASGFIGALSGFARRTPVPTAAR